MSVRACLFLVAAVSIVLKSPHSCAARYCLQGREPSRQSSQDLGSIRLKICYTTDYVFGSHYYQDLRALLLSSADVKVRVICVYSVVENVPVCFCSFEVCRFD